MNGDPPTIHITNDNAEKSRNYGPSQSDHQLSTMNQEERGNKKRMPRISSATPGLFSAIYEILTDVDETGITFAPPPSASSSGYTHQQQRQSTGIEPHERQLSILDPMSDRVSTILVWKNLIVSTREDRKKQFCQKLSSKNPEPKSKRLLHNVSGAITGGLWAVMGKFSFHIYIIRILNVIIIYRSIGFW
jgi:hypothetical protein